MNNNMSLIAVSVSKGIIECDNDTPADGSSLSGTNDDGITKQNTEIAIDETVSIAMTSVSVITMYNRKCQTHSASLLLSDHCYQ